MKFSATSLNRFMKKVAGKDKLVQRANKLMKDEHDHDALSEWVKNKLNGSNRVQMSNEYEESLSNSYRNKEGIYYTPVEIIDDMLDGIKIDTDTTFLDPCCGSGHFVQAIKKASNLIKAVVFGFLIS